MFHMGEKNIWISLFLFKNAMFQIYIQTEGCHPEPLTNLKVV